LLSRKVSLAWRATVCTKEARARPPGVRPPSDGSVTRQPIQTNEALARVDTNVADVRTNLASVNKNVATISSEPGTTNTKLEGVDTKLVGTNAGIEKPDKRLSDTNQRLEKVDGRPDGITKKVGVIDGRRWSRPCCKGVSFTSACSATPPRRRFPRSRWISRACRKGRRTCSTPRRSGGEVGRELVPHEA
jgi:hypothetical protein